MLYCLILLEMQLDDTIIKTIEMAPDQELKEARDLVQRIRRRNLYQVHTFADYYYFAFNNNNEWRHVIP